MFLLRISETGPNTRSKRGRSSLTHLRGPRATTVAARGRLSSSAISPGGEGAGQGPGALAACGRGRRLHKADRTDRRTRLEATPAHKRVLGASPSTERQGRAHTGSR